MAAALNVIEEKSRFLIGKFLNHPFPKVAPHDPATLSGSAIPLPQGFAVFSIMW